MMQGWTGLRRFKAVAWVLSVAGLLAAGAAHGSGIDAGALRHVRVVVADSASDTERGAAAEFADYWKQATGREVETSAQALSDGPGLNVWIGRDGVPSDLLAKLKLDGLGTDGFHMRLLAPRRAGASTQLLIVGSRERGTTYGVYQFLEDYLGVRWLTPELTHVPQNAALTLPGIDRRYVPTLLRRQGTYEMGWSSLPAELRARHSAHWRISPYPQFGGRFVHTSLGLLPPDQYGKEHPDYYSEIDGKRRVSPDATVEQMQSDPAYATARTQLCYSNPEVARAVVDVLRPKMKASPNATIWSVSQNDWNNNCQCAECRKLDAREGTPMGSLLTGINRMADLVKGEFPDNCIETLSYTYTRTPPAHMRARDNVVISLCAIECDYARPLTDPASQRNRYFAQDLRKWSKRAKHLLFWDYPASCQYPFLPFPDFHVLQANYQFFAEHGFIGGFSCGGGQPIWADLGYLRAYVIAHLMWDPYADVQKMMDEYIALYYGEAAPFIHEYIDLLTRAVQREGVVMDCFDRGPWIDAALVTRAQDIFARAFAAATTPEMKERLTDVYYSVELMAIICAPELHVEGNRFIATRPPAPTLRAFVDKVVARGFTSWDAATKDPYEFTKQVLCPFDPPRREESAIEVLENEHYLVWVAPVLKGSVIRWQDKRSRLELIRGFQTYGSYPGLWQDWGNTPFRAEGPAAEAYEVVDRGGDHLILRALREDGLVIERTMTLKPDSDSLEVSLTQKNPTDKELTANTKIHPEFYAQGTDVPKIWACKGGAWQQENQSWAPSNISTGKYYAPEDYTALAFHYPKKKLTLECAFDPAQLGGLLWFFNTAETAEQFNIELLPKNAPLAPGEARAIHGSYRISQRAPAKS